MHLQWKTTARRVSETIDNGHIGFPPPTRSPIGPSRTRDPNNHLRLAGAAVWRERRVLFVRTRPISGSVIISSHNLPEKWLAVKRARIPARRRRKPFRDRPGLDYSSPSEGYTDISRTALRATDESVPPLQFIRLPSSSISLPKYWNWLVTLRRI